MYIFQKYTHTCATFTNLARHIGHWTCQNCCNTPQRTLTHYTIPQHIHSILPDISEGSTTDIQKINKRCTKDMLKASFQLLYHTAPHCTLHTTAPHHSKLQHTATTAPHIHIFTRHILALDNGLAGSVLAVLEHSRAMAYGCNGLAGVPKTLDQLDGRGVLREVPEGPCGERERDSGVRVCDGACV